MKRAFTTFFLATLLGAFSFAQDSFFDNYVYQSWNSFGGLTGTTATGMIQSKDGFINIGTYEGLVRFDGMEFQTIRRGKDNGIYFASTRVIVQDSEDNLWIGSNDEGLQMLSPKGNLLYTTQNGLPNNSVRAIAIDKEQNIWIGTSAGVVYLTPERHLINPQFDSGTVTKGIISTGLYCDTAGQVWLTTENEKGLFVFSNGLFRSVNFLDSFGEYTVTTITQDLDGNFWMGLGTDGIVEVKNGIAKKVQTGTILDTSPAWSIYTAKDGSLWFGTEEGLVVYSEGAFHECPIKKIKGAKINKIICDREGNIWLSTDRNGVGKLSRGRFKMTKNFVTTNAIAEGKDGSVWIGTDKGVLLNKDGKLLDSPLGDYTKGIRIRHIEIASNGDVLVSCYTKPGQLRYNIRTQKITNWTTDDGLAGNRVRVAIESKPGELYVGTTSGLSIIHKDGSIKTFRQAEGLENEYVMCIYKDKNDLVWIGTDGGGIFYMKDEVILGKQTTDNGLAGNIIFKISQDARGSYWICTGSGLSRCPYYDSSQRRLPTIFQTVNADQGLGTDSVFQIFFDKMNQAWITSNYGIARAPFDDFVNAAEGTKDEISIKYYNRNDGLDSDGPTSTALSMCDHNGCLWFTMVDGFAVYDPLKFNSNPVLPLVCIESIKVDSKEYKSPSSTIELNPGTKRVEIKFTGLSFDAPERIKFTHRLTNFENDFSEASPIRSISYTNLKPGKHTFMVNAINGDGLISTQAETCLFVQKPYFYQTKWFWIVASLGFLGTIITIFYLKQRRIKLENIRLESLVKKRTQQLESEKEKSDQLLRAILPDKIATELKDNIHSIGENFSEVTILFSDIVNFTKTSSERTAEEIAFALNDLFSRFDERAKKMGVEKIKTIGDAYMAGCGLPESNPDHAKIMATFAIGMLQDVEDYNKKAQIKFNIRIGLNSGPANAGVIGKTKFIYDVWGNTVNVASRMESAASPNSIKISEALYERIKDCDFKFSAPIECDIKGKGAMTTYDILTGESE